jgi:hypothetical protein
LTDFLRVRQTVRHDATVTRVDTPIRGVRCARRGASRRTRLARASSARSRSKTRTQLLVAVNHRLVTSTRNTRRVTGWIDCVTRRRAPRRGANARLRNPDRIRTGRRATRVAGDVSGSTAEGRRRGSVGTPRRKARRCSEGALRALNEQRRRRYALLPSRFTPGPAASPPHPTATARSSPPDAPPRATDRCRRARPSRRRRLTRGGRRR